MGVFFMSENRGCGMPDKQCYTSKNLFELIGELQKDMQETRTTMKKYNGLYSKLAEVKTTVDDMQPQQKGRQSVGSAIRNWVAEFLI